jgi:hypothetical protein
MATLSVINFVLHYGYQFKEDELGRACSKNGEKSAYRILVGKA